MKRIICEMCGGTDLVKQDGVFVCQSCGCKYSLEEARKMMIEGNVDVSGSTVKVDSSERSEKLYQLARRENERFDGDASKYYEELAIEFPNDWEATFYNDYYKAAKTTLGQADNELLKMLNTLKVTCELVKKFETEDRYEEIAEEITAKCRYLSMIWRETAESSYRSLGEAGSRLYINIASYSFSLVQTSADYIVQYFGLRNMALEIYKDLVSTITESWLGYCFNDGTTKPLIEKIKKYDPSYTGASLPSSGGCYVATAVYGSYDCPEVWTLRRFRDYDLAETWYGRLFVRIYYAISPTLVKWFGKTKWFKKMWRGRLDRMVKKLQAKGYESTPYEDRQW